MSEILSWKGAAALGAAIAALSVTPWAAIILSIGIAAVLVLWGLERTFRGYAEIVRAQSDKA